MKPPTCGAILFCAAALSAAAPAQIVTENAGPASPELPALREAPSIRETRNVQEMRLDSQLIWSPTPQLETRTTVPLLWRDFIGGTETEGLGDIALRVKHSLWQEDEVLESTRLAALYEASFPTGEDDARNAQGLRLPLNLQLGAGAFGFGAGGAYTVIRDRHRFSIEGFYRHTLEHDGFSLGDIVRGNLAYWYRLLPASFSEGPERDPLEVRGVIELLSSYRFESRAGQGLEDKGTEVWLAPGIQLFGRGRLLFEGSFQFPIYQDVDDAFGRREWAALLSVKWLI